ncbi:MAG: hypothetical protein Q8N56_01425 [bacterium]|nr:hypothetical protein [bacterium]
MNKFINNAFRKYWKIIVVLILANLAVKIPYKSNFFDGLEYEDSYIYKASARAIYEGEYEFSNINPYYPTSSIYGSIKDSRMSAIFVTNFLGYPYLINLGYRVFGYHVNISNIVSLVFSGLSIVFVFLIALLIIDSLSLALICSFVYLTIPIFNVYASTSLTEPLSTVFLSVVLLVYLIFNISEHKNKDSLYKNILGMASIAFTMIFAILIKTTNISLVLCLPIAGLVYLVGKKTLKDRYSRNKFLMSLSAVIIVFLFSVLVLKFQTAVEINRGDIGVNPFSFLFFKMLAPVFAISFFNFKWYLFYSALFIVGLYFGLRKRNGIFPIVIFFFYFILHTSHYRSYYFTRGVPVTTDEALRYMTSLVSVYSIIVGLGIYGLWQWLKKLGRDRVNAQVRKSIAITVAIFVLGVSILFTLKCRSYFVEDEYNVRIAPVLKTLEYLKNKDDVLITSEHILFQIYGNANLKIMDFCSIENQIPKEEVESLIRSSNVYYLQTMDRGGVDEERYQEQYRYVDSKIKQQIYSGNNFRIFRLFNK